MTTYRAVDITNCTPEEKPWFEAKAMIAEGKLDEAAAHIIANVNPKNRPPDCSVVIRVFISLGRRLDDWVDGKAPASTGQ